MPLSFLEKDNFPRNVKDRSIYADKLVLRAQTQTEKLRVNDEQNR